ncbi:MAG: methyltransferase domain-containing protein [Sandaracinaceae bacterium]
MSPDYEAVPYEGHPIEYASPEALALAARRCGGPRVSLEGQRVLDLGCGDGAHLLPLAFHHPDWTLVGVDRSPRAIEAARSAAASVGVTNVRFEVADVRSYAPTESFDTITAHGIYSWVDRDARASLRRLMAQSLSPTGLGYVCFNAQPGWGVRGRVRDRLRGRSVEEARRVARGLAELVRDAEDPWGQLLARELARIDAASDGYLAHEYLTEHNTAFWLEEVVAGFQQAGLRYAGDAQALHPEGQVSPTLRAAVADLSAAERDATQLVDLLAYRQLRGAVFVREDAPTNGADPEEEDAWVDEASLYGVLEVTSDPFDLSPGVEEPFVSGHTEVRVVSGLAKMAVLTMSSRYPDAFRFDELVQLAADGLAGRGFRPDLDAAPALREGLAQLLQHHMIRARLSCPRVRVEPTQSPTATRLARFEAQTRSPTTPLHSILPLDPLDRALTVALDGRSLDAVAEAVTDAITEGRLTLEGVPDSAFRVQLFVRERIEPLVTLLGRWGLLERGDR